MNWEDEIVINFRIIKERKNGQLLRKNEMII